MTSCKTSYTTRVNSDKNTAATVHELLHRRVVFSGPAVNSGSDDEGHGDQEQHEGEAPSWPTVPQQAEMSGNRGKK